MDGLLVVDKPAGPTSHDVVARVRRALGERRVGHTGTLDPAATGVLCLVLGRATRLAQFLASSDKTYRAVVRFGFATDTGDAQGRPLVGSPSQLAVRGAMMPARHEIDAALDRFRGIYLQQPPAFSAKRIDGTRSHKLARAHARRSAQAVSTADEPPFAPRPALPACPAPVAVTVHRLEVVGLDSGDLTLDIHCSAGFYVRSLAHDLGERLGVGAHLGALRRTRSGAFPVEQAIPLDDVERDPARAAAAIVPMSDVLPQLPAFRLSAEGVRRALNGCELGPRDAAATEQVPGPAALIRLLSPSGELVGIARPGTLGLLHPSVVLM